MSRYWFALIAALLCPLLICADQPQKPRLDSHGFPLPAGAIARLGDLRFVPGERIFALAVSPDGKLVATAGAEKVYFLNPQTGRVVRQLIATKTGSIQKLTFSKNGRFLAAATNERHVVLWDVITGKTLWSNKDPVLKSGAEVRALHFLDNDRVLAVAIVYDNVPMPALSPKECEVQLWDVQRGTMSRVWNMDKEMAQEPKVHGLQLEFIAVALSPSGQTMAWLGAPTPYDKARGCSIFLYETLTGHMLHQVKGVKAPGKEVWKGLKPLRRMYLLDEGDSILLEISRAFENGGRVVIGAKSVSSNCLNRRKKVTLRL